MIACLRGELLLKTADTVVVDVGGVGYEVFFPRSGQARLPDLGVELFLHVQTVVREDAINLYGFLALEEKEMFQLLVTVSGVGPKLAVNILSGISTAELARAIAADDVYRLTKLHGVGKKTAERLCLELKDKVNFLPQTFPAAQAKPSLENQEDQRLQDAVSALLNLGYPVAKAREVLAAVRRQTDKNSFAALSIEDLIRQALRALA